MKIENIEKILAAAKNKRICIIGDVMLDRYMLGDVNRISPEAPVQVFDIKKSEPKLGGAANVSLNVKTLGANPFLIGVIGNDSEAHTLKKAMEDLDQDTSAFTSFGKQLPPNPHPALRNFGLILGSSPIASATFSLSFACPLLVVLILDITSERSPKRFI